MNLARVARLLVLILCTSGVCLAVCPSPRHHLGDVNNYALSPDAKRIAALAEDGTLFWWDVTTGKRVDLIACVQPSSTFGHAIVFSPDSTQIAIVVHGAVHVLELPSGEITARLTDLSTDEIESIVFSADGRRLAASHKKGVTVWAIATTDVLLSIPEETSRLALSLNREGSLLALAGDQGIRIWDVDNRQVQQTIALPEPQFAESLLFVNEGTLVSALARAKGRANRGTMEFDREITLWHAATGAKLKTLEGETEEGPFPMAATDRHVLFAFGYSGTMRSWDLDTGRLLAKLPMPPAYVSADGKFLLAHGRTLGSLELWKVGAPDDEVQSFVYKSPVCTARAALGAATESQPADEDGSELLWMGSSIAKDHTMMGLRGYTMPDCIRLNTAHGEFASEQAAEDELRDELSHMTGAVVEQGPREIFGMVYGKRALAKFPARKFHSEFAVLLLTEGKHFYTISSTSLELVLDVERKYYH